MFEDSLVGKSDAGSEYIPPSHITYVCIDLAPSIALRCPLALISLILVDKLGLLPRPMSMPFNVLGAFVRDGRKNESIHLTTFVKLIIISLCAQWTSFELNIGAILSELE